MNAIECILSRVSAPVLVEPAPAEDELKTILKAGFRAPDHGALKPYRFYIVAKERRAWLAEQLVAARQPDDKPVEKLKTLPFRAPLIIIATAKINNAQDKVPRTEQLLCVGAAVQNMWLACHHLGYGAIWRTGAFAYNKTFNANIGLAEDEEIVGFLYVGTKNKADREVPDVNFDQHVAFL